MMKGIRKNKKHPLRCLNDWLRGPDSNRRPSGYEPDELPGCSTPRPSVALSDFSHCILLKTIGCGGRI